MRAKPNFKTRKESKDLKGLSQVKTLLSIFFLLLMSQILVLIHTRLAQGTVWAPAIIMIFEILIFLLAEVYSLFLVAYLFFRRQPLMLITPMLLNSVGLFIMLGSLVFIGIIIEFELFYSNLLVYLLPSAFIIFFSLKLASLVLAAVIIFKIRAVSFSMAKGKANDK
jgi:hypothetical protein